MKISNIGKTLNSCKNACLKATNEIGACVKGGVQGFGTGAAKAHDAFIKSGNSNKLCKETAIGTGVLLAAVGLLALCVKGIVNKVKEVKDKK